MALNRTPPALGHQGGVTQEQDELGAQRVSSSPLSLAGLSEAQFEIVAVDSRAVPGNATGAEDLPHWAASAIVNLHYAELFGYSFRYVQVDWSCKECQGLHPAWSKVFYVAERLAELPRSAPPTWLLLLDTDAFITQPRSIALADFLLDLAGRYGLRRPVGLVAARMEPVEGEVAAWRPPGGIWWVNSGVLLIQLGAASQRLYTAWLQKGAEAAFFRLNHPWEQGALYELLNPVAPPCGLPRLLLGLCRHGGGSDPGSGPAGRLARQAVALVNMTEMNSPWGRFVQHWAGYWRVHHPRKARAAFLTALRHVGVNSPTDVAARLEKVHALTTVWRPVGLHRWG